MQLLPPPPPPFLLLLPLLLLQAGGIAGTTVDVVLFPLDTVKTRLQSKEGFGRTDGFKKIYAGIGPAALGSAPSGEQDVHIEEYYDTPYIYTH